MTEKLRSKMWESFASFVVGFLGPYQQLRMAKVDVKIKQMNAMCDHEIKTFNETGNTTDLRQIADRRQVETSITRVEPTFVVDEIDRPYLELHIQQLRVNQNNLHSALNIADSVIANSSSMEDSNNSVDTDWIYRWQKYASEVSNKDMQQLWGRILANEFINPNRYSLRVLEFLKTLSKEEAELITKVGKFSFDGVIFCCSSSLLDSGGVSFADLLHLKDIGVLANTDFNSIGYTYTADECDKTFRQVIVSFDVSIIAECDDASRSIESQVIMFTQLGKDVLSLANIKADKGNIDSVVTYLTSLGFATTLARTSVTLDNQVS